jgi:hypothetical protein
VCSIDYNDLTEITEVIFAKKAMLIIGEAIKT